MMQAISVVLTIWAIVCTFSTMGDSGSAADAGDYSRATHKILKSVVWAIMANLFWSLQR